MKKKAIGKKRKFDTQPEKLGLKRKYTKHAPVTEI